MTERDATPAGGEVEGGGRRTPLDRLDAERRALVEAALRARERAHAPYSGFRVGAAVAAADGTVQPGCNVEISSYSMTLCAERVALFAARAAGHTDFRALAVAGPEGDESTPPCGACRQVIWDLAGDIEVLLVDGDAVEVWRAAELYPNAFGPERLG